MSMHERSLSNLWRRTLMCAVSAVSLGVALATQAAGQGASGRWEGLMRRGKSTLPIALSITDADPPRGSFTAGDLGAMNVPLARLRLGPKPHWELVGDQSTVVFDGVLRGDSIVGSFTESAHGGTFQLRRVSRSPEPPYNSTDVRFKNGVVELAGTVFAPKTRGRHPAVVFLHGSGPEGRWANAYLADYLARNGVVALIYDKRGVGESTGDWKTSSLEDLAADGRAGVDLLAERADVDRSRLGVYGHSQGGFIAPMVAADERVRWIIDADGNVGPQYEQDLFRVRTALAKRFRGDSLRDAVNLYREFVDVARNGTSRARFHADVAASRNAAWLDALGLPGDSDWIWTWYAKIGNADNRAAWAHVRVPVLLLYGSNDELVPPRASIDAIRRILAEHGNHAVTVHVFAGADHTLRLPPADSTAWPRYAPPYPTTVREWIAKRG
jgi:hypothetical protein